MFRTFSPPVSRLFPSAGVAVVPWWLSGGVSAANCILAFQPKGAASQAASYVNLANPGTYDATVDANAPTWDSVNGWYSDGTKFLSVAYTPPNTSARTVIVRISNAATDAALRFIFGWQSTTTGAILGIRNTSTINAAIYTNGTDVGYIHSTKYASGVLAISGLSAYANGSFIGSIPASSYNLSTSPLNIMRCFSVAAQNYIGCIQAIAVYDTVLTAPQVAAVSAAMAAIEAPAWWLSGGVAAANAIGAYQAKGAASLAASYVNLANPGTYNLTLGSAPAWTSANGWQAGSNAYLRTGITPAAGWSAAVRISGWSEPGSGHRVYGEYQPSVPNAEFGFAAVGTTKYFANGGSATSTIANPTSGVFIIAGQKAYYNGTDLGITIPAWSGTAIQIFLLGLNNNNTAGFFMASGYLQVVAFYNSVLSTAQVAALNAAMAAL